jgi:hypothetical protein
MAGRTAELGRESLLGAVVMLTIYFISRRCNWLALSCMFFSFFIKPTGVLLFCSMVTFLLLLYCLRSRFFVFKQQRKFLLTFVVMFIFTALMYKITSDSQSGTFLALGGFFNNFYHFYSIIPLSGVLLLTVVAAASIYLSKVIWLSVRNRQMPIVSSENATVLFLLIFIFGFWVAYVIFTISLPRYTAITIFPIFVLLGIIIKSRITAITVAVLFAVSGYLLWDNRFMPALPAGASRSGDLIERNRDYLKDLDSNRKLCKLLEENFYNQTIVAKPPFLQMLTVPEFGYVEKPLPKVVSAVINTPQYCPAIKNGIPGIPANALLIYSPNACEYGLDDFSLVPFRGDKIIYLDGVPPAANVIYMKHPARPLFRLRELHEKMK